MVLSFSLFNKGGILPCLMHEFQLCTGHGESVNELHAMLKLHEESLPKKDANPALHAIRAGRVQKNQKNKPHKAGRGGKGKGKNKMGYAQNNVPFAPKPKTPPPPKKDNPAKDAICHQCGEVGHWRRNCPVYLTELMKKKKLSQGASASVSSRYGYVYLLKHKHEVFETFKVFQKEVENQLGKTIKSLRSDRGGEYMSQEFLDHLKEHGIIAHRTPPYTPQNNGVSERRNRTLLDMVRSMMSQTTLPKSFWDYCALRLCHAFSPVPFKSGSCGRSLKLIQEEDTNLLEDTSLKIMESSYKDSHSYSAYYGYELANGCNTAFLMDMLSDEVYMEQLGRSFAMKDLGDAAYILGIKIYRDRSKRLIGLNQSAYIEKILKRFYMENSKRGTIPMQEKLKLSKSQGASTPAEKQRMQNIPYASAIGSIMYAVRCTRLDVAFAQNMTSRFQQNPGEEHWTAVKNILKYLRNTKDMFLVSGVNMKTTAQTYQKTTVFLPTFNLPDAEYIAAFDASKEAVWIRKFIFGLGVVPTIEEPINMYCDNTGAIAIAKDHGRP
ncbi:retrotransposon protein, putative, ty1-copia subclass [Tanacetum coccineum]